MLTIIPKAWYSWYFSVVDQDRPLAFLDLSSWREKGTLTIEGVEHRVYREGVMSGDFVLERNGTVLARASKPSALFNRFVVAHQGREFTLASDTPPHSPSAMCMPTSARQLPSAELGKPPKLQPQPKSQLQNS